MTTCPNCGWSIPSNATTCPVCGAPLAPPAASPWSAPDQHPTFVRQPAGPPSAPPPSYQPPSPYEAYYQAAPPPAPRRRSGLLVATVLAAIVTVIIGVVAGVVLLTRGDRPTAAPPVATTLAPPAPETTEAPSPALTSSAPPSATASPTASPTATELTQASEIEKLLNSSGTGRKLVISGGKGMPCNTTTAQRRDLQGALQNRRTLQRSLRAIDLSAVPEGAKIKTLMNAFLTHSINADLHYLAQAKPSVCPDTSEFALGQDESPAAVEAKKEFLTVWNPVATRLGLRTYDDGQI